MRRNIAAAWLATLALCVSGCSATDEPGRGTPTDTAPGAAAPVDASGLARGTPSDDLDQPAPDASPTHDDVSDAEAIAVASAAIGAYLRRDLPQRAWLEALEPHLTTAAMVSLSSVDPAAIPATSLSGQVALERNTSGFLARVTAPTDSGDYALLLVRQGSEPWLVNQITPPGAAS